MMIGADVTLGMRGQGYGKKMYELMMDYCFKKLKMHMLYLYTSEYNKIAVSLYKKMGFKVTGRITDYKFLDGKYYDVFVMCKVKK